MRTWAGWGRVPLEKALLEKMKLQEEIIAVLPSPWASAPSRKEISLLWWPLPSLICGVSLVKQKLLAACCRNFRSLTWNYWKVIQDLQGWSYLRKLPCEFISERLMCLTWVMFVHSAHTSGWFQSPGWLLARMFLPQMLFTARNSRAPEKSR